MDSPNNSPSSLFHESPTTATRMNEPTPLTIHTPTPTNLDQTTSPTLPPLVPIDTQAEEQHQSQPPAKGSEEAMNQVTPSTATSTGATTTSIGPSSNTASNFPPQPPVYPPPSAPATQPVGPRFDIPMPAQTVQVPTPGGLFQTQSPFRFIQPQPLPQHHPLMNFPYVPQMQPQPMSQPPSPFVNMNMMHFWQQQQQQLQQLQATGYQPSQQPSIFPPPPPFQLQPPVIMHQYLQHPQMRYPIMQTMQQQQQPIAAKVVNTPLPYPPMMNQSSLSSFIQSMTNGSFSTTQKQVGQFGGDLSRQDQVGEPSAVGVIEESLNVEKKERPEQEGQQRMDEEMKEVAGEEEKVVKEQATHQVASTDSAMFQPQIQQIQPLTSSSLFQPYSTTSTSDVMAAVAAANSVPSAAMMVTEPDVYSMDAQQLRATLQQTQMTNQRLVQRYGHLKKSMVEMQAAISPELNATSQEQPPPPEIIYHVHRILEEAAVRDQQLNQYGVTIDTTVPPTPLADYAATMTPQQLAKEAAAVKAERARGRQRGKRVPVRRLVEPKRKRQPSTGEAEAADQQAKLQSEEAADAQSMGADEEAIFSLSSLATQQTTPTSARPQLSVRPRSPELDQDKKTITQQTAKPRKDSTEHAYGTRQSNRMMRFVYEASPTTESDEEDEEGVSLGGEGGTIEPRPPRVKYEYESKEEEEESEEYELEAEEEEEEESDSEISLNEVDDEEFVTSRSKPRSRVRSSGGSRSRMTVAADGTPLPTPKKRVAEPGHHAMTSISNKISRYPLCTIFVKVQKMWTEGKDDARKLSPAEQRSLVLVPVRFMVMNPEYRQVPGQLTVNDIFVIAKDISVLIHKRKGSVAKSIYNFEDSEKVRIHVCSRPREAGRGSGVVGGGLSVSGGGASTTGLSTQVLTVLSYRGMIRLMKHSRSSLAPHVQKWAIEQYHNIIRNELVLKEHRIRAQRMDRLRTLAPAQQKHEEAKLLRMEEEEEMDVYEGFEELAGGDGGVSDEEDGDYESVGMETGSVATSEPTGEAYIASASATPMTSTSDEPDAVMRAASSAVPTLAAAAAAAGPLLAPSPHRSRPKRPSRKKTSSSSRQRKPRPSRSAQPAAKRIKREPGEEVVQATVIEAAPSSIILPQYGGAEEAEGEEGELESMASSEDSEMSTSVGVSPSQSPRAAAARSHHRHPSISSSRVPSRRGSLSHPQQTLFALTPDPNVYQAQVVPDEAMLATADAPQVINQPFPPPPTQQPLQHSPYITIQVPAQTSMSSGPREVVAEHPIVIPPSWTSSHGSGTLSQVLQSQRLAMQLSSIPSAYASIPTQTSSASTEVLASVVQVSMQNMLEDALSEKKIREEEEEEEKQQKQFEAVAHPPPSPTKQMDTFEMSKLDQTQPASSLPPSEPSSTATSPMFAALPPPMASHPTMEQGEMKTPTQ